MLQEKFDEMLDSSGLSHLPKDDIQYQEMRRAFFGGAALVFVHVVTTSHDMSEEQAMVELDALDKELSEFVDKIENGEA